MDRCSLRLCKVQLIRCLLLTEPQQQVSRCSHCQQHFAILNASSLIFLQLFFDATVHICQPDPTIPSLQSENRMVAGIGCRIVQPGVIV